MTKQFIDFFSFFNLFKVKAEIDTVGCRSENRNLLIADLCKNSFL